MDGYKYDNKLAQYTQRQLDAYAEMVHETINDIQSIPDRLDTLEEELMIRVRDINREMFLRMNRQ